MTKQEFVSRIDGRTVSQIDYETIEFVYSYHPVISNTKGKDQIAGIYNFGGIRVIKDMVPTAEKAKQYEDEIKLIQREISERQAKVIAARQELVYLGS